MCFGKPKLRFPAFHSSPLYGSYEPQFWLGSGWLALERGLGLPPSPTRRALDIMAEPERRLFERARF